MKLTFKPGVDMIIDNIPARLCTHSPAIWSHFGSMWYEMLLFKVLSGIVARKVTVNPSPSSQYPSHADRCGTRSTRGGEEHVSIVVEGKRDGTYLIVWTIC